MPLVRDYESVQALYKLCADHDLVMARIGYSDQDQIHAIVRGAARFGADHGIKKVPIGIFATVGHYIMQQLPRYRRAVPNFAAAYRLPPRHPPAGPRFSLYREAWRAVQREREKSVTYVCS